MRALARAVVVRCKRYECEFSPASGLTSSEQCETLHCTSERARVEITTCAGSVAKTPKTQFKRHPRASGCGI